METDVGMLNNDYSSFFKQMIEGWQREADEKYPIWPNTNNEGHVDFSSFCESRAQADLDRSFFLQGKAQAYAGQWNKWKPYRKLVKKIDVLWPNQVDTCPQIEATNLLTYMMRSLSRRRPFI
ncbi:unnamed protein product [Thlaspi arvense]|uniref:Uncharacterized protein n=1 Tax=Thlaspi arvense TaxID=13288 RepID=A0AAU9SXY0_THLAR|nr:unnamed protein product [Thlaspi arvense]